MRRWRTSSASGHGLPQVVATCNALDDSLENSRAHAILGGIRGERSETKAAQEHVEFVLRQW